MTTLEVLVAARALIDTPDKWCQGSYEDYRYRHCTRGALWAIDQNDVLACRALYVAMPPPNDGLTTYNDTHSHAEVMALFDRAIAAQEGR